MSTMESRPKLITQLTLEELENHFEKEMSFLKTCLQLRNIDQSSSIECILETVEDLRGSIIRLKQLANAQKEELQKLKAMKSLQEDILNRIFYLQSCTPALENKITLSDATNNNDKNIPAPAQEQCNAKSEIQTTTKARSKVVPKVAHLNNEEFASISDYMRGRLTQGSVNAVIDGFNKTIECKYKMINNPRSQMPGENLIKLGKFREQQSDKTKGIFFCDFEDLKEFASLKQDNITKNSIIIMRHCKRIREIRGPGPILRMAVIPDVS